MWPRQELQINSSRWKYESCRLDFNAGLTRYITDALTPRTVLTHIWFLHFSAWLIIYWLSDWWTRLLTMVKRGLTKSRKLGKGYFHSTMLMQALRKGFLRVKKKRDRAGRGLPPVACSFFSFSLCFLFSSSSFMTTGFAASALVAILTPPPEMSSEGESAHRIVPKPGADGPSLPVTPLGSRPAYPECASLPPSLFPPFGSPTVTELSWTSGPVTEKAPSAGWIRAEGLVEQLALLRFKFRAWSTGRAMLGNGETGGLQGWKQGKRRTKTPSKQSGSESESWIAPGSVLHLSKWIISLQYIY